MNKKRNRKNAILLYLSDDEKNLLEAKWKLSGLPSKASFIRNLIVYGFVYDIDYSELKQYNTALSQINNNMNQIARKANTYDMATKQDIKKVKEMMDELWHIQIRNRKRYLFKRRKRCYNYSNRRLCKRSSCSCRNT